jgi:hypothetical protein
MALYRRRGTGRYGQPAFNQELAVRVPVRVLHTLQHALACLNQSSPALRFDNVAANDLGNRMTSVYLILQNLVQHLIVGRLKDGIQDSVDSLWFLLLVDDC